MTVRECYDWAFQCQETRKLSHTQALTLQKLRDSLPQSIQPAAVENMVIISTGESEKRKFYAYNRYDPPTEIIRLYDLTGGYLDTKKP